MTLTELKQKILLYCEESGNWPLGISLKATDWQCVFEELKDVKKEMHIGFCKPYYEFMNVAIFPGKNFKVLEDSEFYLKLDKEK